MFKSAILYRLAALPALDLAILEDCAQARAFEPCGPTQTASAGWVPPRGEKHGALVESVGGQVILRFSHETRAVPAAAVKEALSARLDVVQEQTGRRPRGKAAKEIKEQVIHDLLPRAFPKRRSAPVWICPEQRLVVVGAGSVRAADLIATMVVELLGGVASLQLVQLAVGAAGTMAAWLVLQEPPAGFTIDRECELKQPDSEKSTVRYARHGLDIDEVREHIEQGKLPTQMAMTWNNRVSFVLTEDCALRKLTLLDVALESGRAAAGDGADDAFDADVAIETGELARLLPVLIEALGGERLPSLAA